MKPHLLAAPYRACIRSAHHATRLFVTASFWLLILISPVMAQEGPRSVDLPNRMTVHTWFIIGVVGAFLAWSISYAIQLQKEAIQRAKSRTDLVKQKEELLDQIADLEQRKEAGEVSDQKYKHELKELRFRLGKLLEKISTPATPKSAKKSS